MVGFALLGSSSSASEMERHMDEFSKSGDSLDQADEDILTPTVSDEALEVAAGIERRANTMVPPSLWGCPC